MNRRLLVIFSLFFHWFTAYNNNNRISSGSIAYQNYVWCKTENKEKWNEHSTFHIDWHVNFLVSMTFSPHKMQKRYKKKIQLVSAINILVSRKLSVYTWIEPVSFLQTSNLKKIKIKIFKTLNGIDYIQVCVWCLYIYTYMCL